MVGDVPIWTKGHFNFFARKIEVKLPRKSIALPSIMCNLLGLLIGCTVFYAFLWRSSLRAFSDFPVFYQGHTAVHLLDVNGMPSEPAYMAFVRGEPVFYTLYTNKTIGSYREYSHIQSRIAAYKSIYTSTPLYKGYSLYQILTSTRPFIPRNPTIKRIYAERKRVWWERCVRDWEALRYH